jgi:hypothetical protein
MQTQKSSKTKMGRPSKLTESMTVNETDDHPEYLVRKRFKVRGKNQFATKWLRPRRPDALDEQIVACIKTGGIGGLPVKNRPDRGLTFGRRVKNSMPLAELDRAFPAIPYHKLHYRVKILARSGRIRISRVRRSVMLYVPE